MIDPQAPLKLLVIRRDNIGDLVCTTPMFQALRERFPSARICALVNSYNAAVLERNPLVDEVYVYTKLKHRIPTASAFGILFDRLRMLWRLRRERFDYVLVPGIHIARAVKFARSLRPRHIVAMTGGGTERVAGVDIDVPRPARPLHEVEAAFHLLTALGIEQEPPPVRVYPDPNEVAAAARKANVDPANADLIGIQISSRKPVNRWPAEKFVELMRALHAAHGARFLLLWSPGSSANPRHPGDDETAAAIVAALKDAGVPVSAYPQGPLPQLVADLSLCRAVVTSDGGAMHLAAGMGKPIVCFFGDADPARWRPWRVPQVLLRPASGKVSDISVEETLRAYARLLGEPAPVARAKP